MSVQRVTNNGQAFTHFPFWAEREESWLLVGQTASYRIKLHIQVGLSDWRGRWGGRIIRLRRSRPRCGRRPSPKCLGGEDKLLICHLLGPSFGRALRGYVRRASFGMFRLHPCLISWEESKVLFACLYQLDPVEMIRLYQGLTLKHAHR